MEKKLYDFGDNVNDYIVKALSALTSYTLTQKEECDEVKNLRELLQKAEYKSRLFFELGED